MTSLVDTLRSQAQGVQSDETQRGGQEGQRCTQVEVLEEDMSEVHCQG